MGILDARPEDIGRIKSNAEYIADLCLQYLSSLDSDNPPSNCVSTTLANDVLRQLANISEMLEPYMFPAEEEE